jgi:low affinity Fe/Cu permease
MRPSVVFLIITILLTFVIPLAAINIPLFKEMSLTDSMAYILGFITVTSGCIIAFLQYQIERLQNQQEIQLGQQRRDSADIHESVDRLRFALQEINEITIYAVDRDLLYDRLKHYVKDAKRRVDLMYFGNQPPLSYLKSLTKDAYVDTLDEVIQGKTKNIRRIILHNENNKAWIKSIVDKHSGNERFSVVIIMNEQNLPLVSAQIIDDHLVMLMNLDRSVTPNKPRDIIIESQKVCFIVESYYNEMYSHSIPILVNGLLINENYSKYL